MAMRMVISLAVVFSVTATARTAVAGWRSDFQQAETESVQSGKPLLVHFYADWCGPCRDMESQTLHRPEVQRLLGDAVVGVKINADHRPDLVRRFQVSGLPTDVLVDSNGQVVHRQSGFQSAGQYVASIAGRARTATRVVPRQPGRSPAVQRPAEQSLVARDGQSQSPHAAVDDSEKVRTLDPLSPFGAAASQPPMLRGYSPVALHESRAWTKGLPEYSVEYRGQVYRLSTADEMARFQENPRRYTPRLLGCDAVTFASEDRALPGRLEFAAFYGEELYLFQSAENRSRFKASPDRFTASRVVKLEEIESVVR